MITDEIHIPTTKEIEADGFITPPSALEHTEHANTACTGNATAQPMKPCLYPKCEECVYYCAHYCTVPMVVSKQDWLSMHDWAQKTTDRICDLENLVTEEIIGSKDTIRIDHDGWHKQVVAGEEVWCRDGAHIEVHEGIKYMVGDPK